MDFAVLWLFTKVFSAKCGGVVSSGSTVASTSEQAIFESFLHQNLIFHQFVKVSPTSFPMYSTLHMHVHNRVNYLAHTCA